jgi:hypothetical protein
MPKRYGVPSKFFATEAFPAIKYRSWWELYYRSDWRYGGILPHRIEGLDAGNTETVDDLIIGI